MCRVTSGGGGSDATRIYYARVDIHHLIQRLRAVQRQAESARKYRVESAVPCVISMGEITVSIFSWPP
jgi:50S ribosomal subunit-associated GTPase HflX